FFFLHSISLTPLFLFVVVVFFFFFFVGGGWWGGGAPAALLYSIDVNSYRDDIAAEFRKATGRDLAIEGDIDLSISFAPAIAVERLAVANAGWGSRPAMISLERAEAEVELLPLLAGDVRVTRLILVEPDILLERNAEGLSNWRSRPPAEGEPGAPAGSAKKAGREGATGDRPPSVPAFDHVEVRRGRLTYRDARTGSEMRFDLERASARAASPTASLEIGAEGAWNGVPFSLSGTVESLAGAAAGKPAVVDFEAALDTSDLAGRIELALAGPRPRLAGRLRAGAIDLAGLRPRPGGSGRPASSPGGAKPDKARADRVFPDDPLSLDGLRAVDLDLDLSIGKLAGYAVPVGAVDARVRLDDGRLAAKPFRATVAGSRVEGELHLDARGAAPGLRLAARAAELNVGRLLDEAGVTDLFEGKAKASVDLSGSGGSIAAMMAGLDGDIRIVGGNGRLKTEAIDTAVSGASALLGTLFEGRRQWTAVNCAVASIGIAKGRATSRATLIDTDYSTVAARGTADLASETLALVVEPRAKSATLNVAVPVHVRGSFAAPEIRPDTGAALKKLGGLGELGSGDNECLKTAATGPRTGATAQPRSPSPEKAVRELRDNLKGAVKDIGRGLKGLFRGGKD
ncbi:MAG: AsmA family protein, partial [Alphaproteobacteria bacterium]|nr:AsmA family protein [Alphaproteobacteria bacterium]